MGHLTQTRRPRQQCILNHNDHYGVTQIQTVGDASQIPHDGIRQERRHHQICQPPALVELSFPLRNLVGMHDKTLYQFGQRLVAAHPCQHYLGFGPC